MLIFDLKKLRLDAGYTQQKLAQESNRSLPTIQKIEAGIVTPNLVTVNKLLKILGRRL